MLALEGRLATGMYLGSRSTLVAAGEHGLGHRPLRTGDMLPLGDSHGVSAPTMASHAALATGEPADPALAGPFEIVRGPDGTALAADAP